MLGARHVAWAVCFLLGVAGCGSRIQAPDEPPRSVRRAEEAFQEGRYETAIALYRSYTSVVPQDTFTARSLYKTALAHYRLEQHADTLATLDDLDARYPRMRWVQVDALRGDALRGLGNPVSAIEAWDRGLSAAGPVDAPKIRARVLAAVRDLPLAQLEAARRLAETKEVTRLLDDQMARLQATSLGEPLPDMPSDAELLLDAAEAQRDQAEAASETPAFADDEESDDAAEVAAVDVPPAADLAAESSSSAPGWQPDVEAAPAAVGAPKVGVILPVGASPEREGIIDAIRMALPAEQLEFRGLASANAAPVALKDLADDSSVVAVIGPFDRAAVRDLGGVAGDRQIPVLELSGGPAHDLPFVLHGGANDDERLSTLVDYASNRLLVSHAGILHAGTATGREAANRLRALLGAAGITIVGSEPIGPDGGLSSENLLLQWRAARRMEALFLVGDMYLASEFATFLRRELPDTAVFGHIPSGEDGGRARSSIPGEIYAADFSPVTKLTAGQEFTREFREAFLRDPSALDAYAYEAALLIRQALEAGATTRLTVWRELREGASVEGPTGRLRLLDSRLDREPLLLQNVGDSVQELPNSRPQGSAALALSLP